MESSQTAKEKATDRRLVRGWNFCMVLFHSQIENILTAFQVAIVPVIKMTLVLDNSNEQAQLIWVEVGLHLRFH